MEELWYFLTHRLLEVTTVCWTCYAIGRVSDHLKLLDDDGWLGLYFLTNSVIVTTVGQTRYAIDRLSDHRKLLDHDGCFGLYFLTHRLLVITTVSRTREAIDRVSYAVCWFWCVKTKIISNPQPTLKLQYWWTNFVASPVSIRFKSTTKQQESIDGEQRRYQTSVDRGWRHIGCRRTR